MFLTFWKTENNNVLPIVLEITFIPTFDKVVWEISQNPPRSKNKKNASNLFLSVNLYNAFAKMPVPCATWKKPGLFCYQMQPSPRVSSLFIKWAASFLRSLRVHKCGVQSCDCGDRIKISDSPLAERRAALTIVHRYVDARPICSPFWLLSSIYLSIRPPICPSIHPLLSKVGQKKDLGWQLISHSDEAAC